MQLSELTVGSKARIVRVQAGEKSYRQRLMALGLLPGTELTLTRVAPLGDPVQITVRGCALSLRKAEARILQIEKV
ncbi:MAG: iron transporter [Gammaproteobacteria bacterium RIFCSPHIGHO2_12_FULL_41_20]|nr:MAG: iron transporter [Gammaproteobacteria bacterium RIFCSPHIGHO2_12_FULL_41_20]